MKLQLSNTSDQPNVIGKVITGTKEVTIMLKKSDDVKAPTLILSRSTYDKNYNYAYMPDLKRYYFINDVVNLNNDNVRINLQEDVLQTYKDDILNSTAIITATGKPSYLSSELPSLTTEESDTYTSDTKLDTSAKDFIMVTIGG